MAVLYWFKSGRSDNSIRDYRRRAEQAVREFAYQGSATNVHLHDMVEADGRHIFKVTGDPVVRAKKRRNNANQLLFSTRAAALKYAREHGAKNFSVRKLKRGRA